MPGRASIVGAAETSVGKVRDHNEDAHFIDPELGIFVVCDGMGGHAAGEVASALAVKTIRAIWANESTQAVADRWLAKGTPEAKRQLLSSIQQGVVAAHDAIVAEAAADRNKTGMGTTLVGAMVVGGDIVFAHAGDSRAYLVREGIAMQLTEDHTLLARLLAAGVDVDVEGEGMRFKSMLTNALGIGEECKVTTFVVPVADGDRFLLCSDGITEYLKEAEIGEILTTQPSPARAAQRLVDVALDRGGGDNATALVVRVLEAGETARPAEQLKREQHTINSCPLLAKISPQQRLRALRIALPRDYSQGEKLPAQTLGDRVAWIVIEGELEQDGHLRGPGSLLYPEALLPERPLPDKDGLAVVQSDLRALALRADDFKEICDEDPELGEVLLSALAAEITLRRPHRRTGRIVVNHDSDDARRSTDPHMETQPEIAIGRAGTEDTMPSLRQPRGSTVPPSTVRAKSSTDVGVPVSERTPAELPSLGQSARAMSESDVPALPPAPDRDTPLRPGAVLPNRSAMAHGPTLPNIPRLVATSPTADTPPHGHRAAPPIPAPPAIARTKTPGSGLIVPKAERADAEADVDRAWGEITDEREPERKASDESQPEIIVESGPPETDGGPPLSEPEISIVELAEAVEAEDQAAREKAADDSERKPVVMVATTETGKVTTIVEDDNARVVEIMKDTSSQTITLTVTEPPEPEITVERESEN